mgnify:FL=1|tara:strand:+ start:91 stop:282 length:192 start_codon:yes stop_codon:yes gene_type:complete
MRQISNGYIRSNWGLKKLIDHYKWMLQMDIISIRGSGYKRMQILKERLKNKERGKGIRKLSSV